MRRRLPISLLVFSLSTIAMLAGLGCGAYFNTFYNTNKLFNQAEKQRLEREKKQAASGSANTGNSGNINTYRKAIEKGSKVLQLHPDSKYVDDAIMIIGQSFYHIGEFIKARRKFEELVTYFPKSKYVPRARLWLGKSLIEDGDHDLALATLNELVAQKVDKDIAVEAQVLLGELYFSRKDYQSAIKEYTNLLKSAGEKSQKIDALLRTGKAYSELEEYQKAAMAFKQGIDLGPELEQRYAVELNYGLTLRELKEYERALIWFEKMTKSALTSDEMANVRHEIARTFIEMKEWEKAQITFEEIANDFPKTEYATRAHFELGKMYAGFHGNYSLAGESFQKAMDIAKQSPIYDSLRTWNLNIKEWEKLRFELAVLSNAYDNYDMATTDTVGEYTVEEADADENLFENPIASDFDQTNPQDTLNTAANKDTTLSQTAELMVFQEAQQNEKEQTEKKADVDPRQNTSGARNGGQNDNRRNEPKMKVSVPRNFAALEEKMVQTHNKMAELFLFQFEKPDSALNYYTFLSEHFYDYEMGAHWLFLRSSLEEIMGNQDVADSLFDMVVEKYPDTEYANEARDRLGLQAKSTNKNMAAELFAEAESMFLDGQEPEAALKLFRRIVESHPESEYAAKALYSICWITEWKLHDNDKAMELYSELHERFPGSVYARQTLGKLRAAQMAAKSETADTTENQIERKEPQVVNDNLEIIGRDKRIENNDPVPSPEEEEKPLIDPRKAKRKGAESNNEKPVEEEDPKKPKKPKPEPSL